MSTALVTLSSKLATRFGMEQDGELIDTLKQTAFRSKEPVSDAQLTALLVIANEYGLNPFTKEIYAYPDQHKGIVPVVGVDGWIRIINEHPQFDGMEFVFDPEWVTCTIYRKDRSRPTTITEFLAECKRPTDPWSKMPRRMLRHKALMQCGRVAFGFALHDDEEAVVASGVTIDAATGEITGQEKRGPQRKSAAKGDVVDVTDAPKPAADVSAARPADTQGQPSPDVRGKVSTGQVAYLRKKLEAAKMAESEVCAKYEIGALEDMTIEQFDETKSELLAMT